MKTLIFDLWGEWGHFRKYYATSSPLTFSFIPPTAAMGVIAAIIGLDKEENSYIKVLNDAGTKIGIGLCRPVKKVMLGLNYINTKGNVWVPKQRKEGARTQLRTEFLRDAHFRFYVTMQNQEIYHHLVNQVRCHRTHYTLSLGLSENLANFAYIDEIEAEKKYCNGDPVLIHSVIPLHNIDTDGLYVVEGSYYGKERVPVKMNEARIVSAYEECIFDMKGKGILAITDHYWEGGMHRFIFLE